MHHVRSWFAVVFSCAAAVAVPEFVCPVADTPPTIAGTLTAGQWDGAAVVDDFRRGSRRQAPAREDPHDPGWHQFGAELDREDGAAGLGVGEVLIFRPQLNAARPFVVRLEGEAGVPSAHTGATTNGTALRFRRVPHYEPAVEGAHPYHRLEEVKRTHVWAKPCERLNADGVSTGERLIFRDTGTGAEVWRLTWNPEEDGVSYANVFPWNADGSMMMFSGRHRIGGYWHMLMSGDGTRLWRPNGYDAMVHPRWTQDDPEAVLCSQGRKLFRVNVLTGEKEVIYTLPESVEGRISFGPEGVYAAACKQGFGEGGKLTLINLANGETRPIPLRTSSEDFTGDWLYSGHVTYVEDVPHIGYSLNHLPHLSAEHKYQQWVRNLKTGEYRQVKYLSHGGTSPKRDRKVGFAAGGIWKTDWFGDTHLPPPAAPETLAATKTTRFAVALTWRRSPEPDVHHYQVYRGRQPDFEPTQEQLVGSPSEPQFLDWGLDPGTEYHYCVTAVNTWGDESEPCRLAARTEPLGERVFLSLEAEDGRGENGEHETKEAEGVSGGKYVVLPKETETNTPYRLAIPFQVSRTDRYFVWLSLCPIADTHVYLNVAIDDKRNALFYLNNSQAGDLTKRLMWRAVGAVGGPTPMLWDLEEGEHTLTLSLIGKPGFANRVTAVDCVVVTNDLTFQPEGRIWDWE